MPFKASPTTYLLPGYLSLDILTIEGEMSIPWALKPLPVNSATWCPVPLPISNILLVFDSFVIFFIVPNSNSFLSTAIKYRHIDVIPLNFQVGPA